MRPSLPRMANSFVVLCAVLVAMASVATSAPAESGGGRQRDPKITEQRERPHRRQENPRQQSEQLGIAPLVNSLLTSLLRQTLYTRMENLLLDGSVSPSSSRFPSARPPHPSRPESVRKSGERRRIVDSAVRNYQEQDGGLSQDFTKLAGKFLAFQLAKAPARHALWRHLLIFA